MTGLAVSIGIRAPGSDNQIEQTIAIDITTTTHRPTAVVAFCFTMDDKAALASSNIGKLYSICILFFTKKDIGTY